MPPLSVLFLQTRVASGFLMKRLHTNKPVAYVAFSTFRDALESLNGLALASRIKPSDCGSVSTSSWSQLYRTFRFLKLVDDRDVIHAGTADAVGGQVDAVRIPDRNGPDLPRRA